MDELLHFISDKKNCSGCSACRSICPRQCIKMKRDEEGFLYPAKIGGCTNCKLCEKVCPIFNKNRDVNTNFCQSAYAVISKNEDVWVKSTSGGAFSELCKNFGGNDGNVAIFGACFDGLKVKHEYVLGVSHIDKFRKSKYIQSDIGDSLKEVKNYLDSNVKVIFSGTPCQIAGLKKYLGKEYDNLFCIDFICHGVGSPYIFDYCNKYVENKLKKKILEYTFRVKKNRYGNYDRHVSLYKFSDGTEKYWANDYYTRLFVSQLCLRKSCSVNCNFRSRDRQSDVTIADFNGLSDIFPNIKDNRNYSTVIINTLKGKNVFEQMKKCVDYYECSLNDISKYNKLFDCQGEENFSRNEFFSDYMKGVDVIKKYAVPLNYTMKQKIIRLCPWVVKDKIKRVLRKIK